MGRTLTEIAAARKQRPAEAFSELAQMSIGHEAATGEMGDMMIGTSMRDDDIAAFIAWPHTNICTDGSLRDRHPRGAGSFPPRAGAVCARAGRTQLGECDSSHDSAVSPAHGVRRAWRDCAGHDR